MKLSNQTAHYQRDAEHFDYFAPRSGADLDAARRIQQGVLHALPRPLPSSILDLGSGSGWLLEETLSRSEHPLVVSVDLGVANLRILRRRFPEACLVAADADHLPFRGGSFGVAVASEVLEHLNHPDRALAELASVLRPGGRLVASTPYREMIRYYLCIHCNQPTPVNAHLHSFDEHALTALFRQAGLSGVTHFTFLNKALVFLRLSQLLRFLPWRVWCVIDRLCNFVLRKPHSIVIHGDRPHGNRHDPHND